MPWCDDCAKFWTPTSMPPDGSCPTCGAIIGDPPDTRVPWHFWVLVGALALYLGWRLIQGFQWLIENDHALLTIPLGAAVIGLVLWLTWGFWRRREDDELDVHVDGSTVDGSTVDGSDVDDEADAGTD